jgi:hypothetical protein
MALGLCSSEAMQCDAAQVRAVERAAYCANASMLSRHGEPPPDAGISCLPR